MAYSTRHVSDLFGVSRQTVRTWSIEFADFLSPGATPGEGRRRQFNEDDLRVFALIREQKKAGMLFEDIHLALGNGLMGDLPSGVDLAVSKGGQEKMRGLSKRVAELEGELSKAREHGNIQAVQIKMLEEQINQQKEEIRQLNREIGRLEVRDDDD
jgi:DNA-binding transcriptional MerR regulator